MPQQIVVLGQLLDWPQEAGEIGIRLVAGPDVPKLNPPAKGLIASRGLDR